MNKNRAGYIAHEPVMGKEVVDLLLPLKEGSFIDATYGSGAHFSLVEASYSKFNLHGIDRDEDVFVELKQGSNVFKYNFSFIDTFVKEKKINNVIAILFDFGISTHQLETDSRGFSFQRDSLLDMRMDQAQELNAHTFINNSDEEELFNVLKDYGEERYSRKIAKSIVIERPIQTTRELSEVIKFSLPRMNPTEKNKSIRRCFQAIRIHVNQELEHIKKGLEKSIAIVEPEGIVIAISYHSLEDRLVKKIFREKALTCLCPVDFPKCVCEQVPSVRLNRPSKITPKKKELNSNKKSSSAVLRSVIKL